MNKAQAIQVLEESFSRPCATPDYGAKDREAYLDAEKKELLELVIEPLFVVARTSDWARTHGRLPDETYEMYAIACSAGSWLLYDPSTKMFSLANGSIEEAIELVGFASDDALAEWRG